MARIQIRSDADLTRAVLHATQVARSSGFSDVEGKTIATAVSELAKNILKYAGAGSVDVVPTSTADRTGITITVSDRGPGIENIEEALQDHFSSGGTLGLGLPGVKRMAHEFEISSVPGDGTKVVVQFFTDGSSRPRAFGAAETVQRSPGSRVSSPTARRGWGGILRSQDEDPRVETAFFIRPARGERVSGDEVLLERRGDLVLIGVVDGLGHGKPAHSAATEAKKYLRAHWTDDPVENLQLLDDHLATTIGAAVGVGVLNIEERTLRYAAIGNTVLRLVGGATGRVSSVEGTVGANTQRRAREHRIRLGERETLLCYSDGMSDRFEVDDYPQMLYDKLTTVVASLVDRWGKAYDDVSCVALRIPE
jgi:anti-sigma regulatory factor (Ser/Thr protein kinase)